MRAGSLRHFITIQHLPISTKGDFGEQKATNADWDTFAQVWAEVSPIKGQDLARAQAVWPKVDVTINIRYLAGLTPDMRVVFNDKLYHLHAVINTDERNREMQLLCETGVKAG